MLATEDDQHVGTAIVEHPGPVFHHPCSRLLVDELVLKVEHVRVVWCYLHVHGEMLGGFRVFRVCVATSWLECLWEMGTARNWMYTGYGGVQEVLSKRDPKTMFAFMERVCEFVYVCGYITTRSFRDGRRHCL